jgi:hypothetical protein
VPDPVVNESNPGGNNTSGSTPAAGDEFKPISSQEELNKVIGDRVKRAKPADYDDLKAKAARLDEMEQANQSEIEKANNRATAAEEKAAKVPALVADALRGHLIALHKIPDDKAELFLTATDPALLLRQVTALVGETKKQGNHVPREGATNSNSGGQGDEREFVRNLFGHAD